MGYLLNAEIFTKKDFLRLLASASRICYILLLLWSTSCSRSDNLEAFSIKTYPDRQNDFSLWQLYPFDFEVQMCYIIKTDDNKVIVVDGGLPSSLDRVTSYLQQLGEGRVHTWVITHPHLDHVGVLNEAVYRKTLQIDRILHSRLDEDWVLKNEPDGHSLVLSYHTRIEESGIPMIDVQQGDIYSIGDGIELRIVGVKNDSITVNAINNSSLVFKVQSKSKSVLFLGDLGVEGGNELLNSVNQEELKADYVQMAHHGNHGVGLEFYKAIDAHFALWPTPKWLWENKAPDQGPGTGNYQTPEVRSWTENELGIKKNYVSGLEGNIQID